MSSVIQHSSIANSIIRLLCCTYANKQLPACQEIYVVGKWRAADIIITNSAQNNITAAYSSYTK